MNGDEHKRRKSYKSVFNVKRKGRVLGLIVHMSSQKDQILKLDTTQNIGYERHVFPEVPCKVIMFSCLNKLWWEICAQKRTVTGIKGHTDDICDISSCNRGV